MALQSALSRLRGNSEPPEGDNSRQRKPEEEKREQAVQQRKVFSIEAEEKDLFDIDNDFFSDADLLLLSSPPHLPSVGGNHDNHPGSVAGSNCSQERLSGDVMVTSPLTQPTFSTQPLMLRGFSTENEVHNPQKASSVTKKAFISPSTSNSPSISCIEKLKCFSYTKTPERKGREQVGGVSQEPPAKKRNIDPVSPSPDVHQQERVISQEAHPPHTGRPGQSSHKTHNVGVSMPLQQPTHCQRESSSDDPLKKSRSTRPCGGEANPRDSGVSTASTFRRPIFNPRKDANSSTSAGAPFASIARDRNAGTPSRQHTTAQTTPYQQSNTESILSSCSQTLTDTHTPSTPRQFPHLNPRTATPTSLSSTPSLSHNHPSSAQSSSHTPSSRPLPFPPSSFSTPQRAPNTTTIVRRFPGPAGVLPKLVRGQCLDRIVVPSPPPPTPASTPRAKTLVATPSHFPSCSQSNTTDGRSVSGSEDPVDFTQGPWKSMLQDLDMNDVYSAPLLKCSIARAIKQASRQQLRNGKVTHLRVMLKSIVSAGRNASAVLKDPTGEILCTIHQSVLEEYQQELQPGAVFILRQVTVFSPAPRKHYLSITPDNIVMIYPASDTVTRRPICLTEMEKRFGDLTDTKENQNTSTDNLTNPKNSRINFRAHNMTGVGLSSVQRELHEHNPSASQTSSSTPSSSPMPWDHTHQITSHRQSAECHSQQPMDSIFSDQFFDDEFDSLVGSMDDGLEF